MPESMVRISSETRVTTNFLPIWSASANWNLAEHSWMQYDWLDFFSLKVSFGYQGNMPTDQSPIMIIKKRRIE